MRSVVAWDAEDLVHRTHVLCVSDLRVVVRRGRGCHFGLPVASAGGRMHRMDSEDLERWLRERSEDALQVAVAVGFL